MLNIPPRSSAVTRAGPRGRPSGHTRAGTPLPAPAGPGRAEGLRRGGPRGGCYLTVTVAPAPSRAALAFSAVSLLTRSSSGLGAPSTRSLASLRPRLVRVRTSLMTWIFLSPAASRMTSNSSFSSASSAAAPPPRRAAAATATGAAALTSKVVLELLHELGELDQRHLLERVEQVVSAELRHGGASSVFLRSQSVVTRPPAAGWLPARGVRLLARSRPGPQLGRSAGAAPRRRAGRPRRRAWPPARRPARAICWGSAANVAAAPASDAFMAPASLASSTSRGLQVGELDDLRRGRAACRRARRP